MVTAMITSNIFTFLNLPLTAEAPRNDDAWKYEECIRKLGIR